MRAAVYLRISQDRTGNELGVARQREDAVALVRARGWDLVGVYVDNDVSATSGKERSQWQVLMALVEAGSLEVVVGWTIDRVLRTGRDRLRMLDAGRAHGITFSIVRGSDMDLSTPAGRLAADILGAVAQNEMEVKSDRQKRAARQAAEQGRWVGGRRPFGYEADGVTPRKVEADALAAAYDDYLAGVPIVRLAQRWNSAGMLSGLTRPNGEPTQWSHSGVRNLLRNPRNAGFRAHNGQIVGKAVWPPIISESTYRAAVALLDSAASEYKPHGGRRLLSGLARCGVCGGPIVAGGSRRGHPQQYRCARGHMVRRAEPVEEAVAGAVLLRVVQPDFLKLVGELVHDDGHATSLIEEAERLRTEMDAIARERMQRTITPRQFAVMNAELILALDGVERRMATTSADGGLRDFVVGGVTQERWDALGVDRQRIHIESLMSIALHPVGRGVRRPAPDTVEMTWKTALTRVNG